MNKSVFQLFFILILAVMVAAPDLTVRIICLLTIFIIATAYDKVLQYEE